ncbi:hypothetical protein JR316_0010343 [Psilocybe cubensis]|uniref:Uncharacterized protein n=2 Tax=Psilocybe cubensis TaxID=181762 RepID=A0ACB8GQU1_PSICU|nr:hypothetical protein JR316_0010343 [Psilocybe cubensis]KAH9478105.1 hypothetical protein JR316_0010343 [Psilocybe cubensis]
MSSSGLPPSNALFPALYLYPLNDTWAPKHIALTSMHTKIGRQTSSKTAPGERNGFFDSKVLSRQHAEVWEEGGKIYIKDVKSSNGTFINGERLSSEGHESEPFELKSDDIVEFGIDIVGEDNKTIIHHKVAARVVCVFTEQDAQVAARAEQHQAMQAQQQAAQHQQQHPQQHGQHGHPQGAGGFMGAGQQGLGGLGGQAHGLGGPMGLGAMGGQPQGVMGGLGVNGGQTGPGGGQGAQNFPFGQGQPGARRPQLAQGLGSMGGIGLRPPGKTGLSFDVILSRLQGEVQKSRETGAELGSLTSAMGEIGDVLGGVGVPANLPPFPAHLPPVRAPPPEAQPSIPLPPPPAAVSAPAPAPAATSPSAPNAAPASAEAASTSTSTSTSATASTSTSTDQTSTSSPPSTSAQPAPSGLSATLIAELQAQIRETQSSLAAHHDRVRQLEGALEAQEGLRREVVVLRELVMRGASSSGTSGAGSGDSREVRLEEGSHEEAMGERHRTCDDEDEGGEGHEDDDEEEEDDDDDARSVSTIIPHELESVEEEDEEAVARAERGEDGDGDPDHEARDAQHGVEDTDHSVSEAVDPSTLDQEHEHEQRHEHGSEDEAEAEKRKQEDLKVGRPRTPEPSLLGMGERRASPLVRRRPRDADDEAGQHPEVDEDEEDGEEDHFRPSLPSSVSDADDDSETEANPASKSSAVSTETSTSAEVLAQVSKLSAQVSSVVALSEALHRQHAEAQGTIRALEKKVEGLEEMLRAASAAKEEEAAAVVKEEPVDDVQVKAEPVTEEPSSTAITIAATVESALAEKMALWKKAVEGQWSSVRDEWRDERARLERAREEWEARVRLVEFGLERVRDAEREREGEVTKTRVNGGGNGNARGGLATPPSPRSQSSDSGRYRRRKKRAALTNAGATSTSAVEGSSGASGSEDEEDRDSGDEKAPSAQKLEGRKGVELVDDPTRMLATPEPSVVFKLSESAVSSLDGDRDQDESHLSGKTRTHPLADSSDVDADVLSRSFDEDSVAGQYEQSSGEGLEGEGIEGARASPFSSSSTYARDALLILFWVFVSCVLGVLGVFVGLAISVYSWLVSGVVWISSSSVARWLSTVDLDSLAAALPDTRVYAWATQTLHHLNKGKGKDSAGNPNINVQTAVGVVLLSVAAAAVFWKIKPE